MTAGSRAVDAPPDGITWQAGSVAPLVVTAKVNSLSGEAEFTVGEFSVHDWLFSAVCTQR